jgi:ATP-dependent Clp protease ATP-binding subunit ClpX
VAGHVDDSSRPSISRETGSKLYLLCSFRGKNENQVKRLNAGPGRVYICNECVEVCVEVLAKERGQVHGSDPAAP